MGRHPRLHEKRSVYDKAATANLGSDGNHTASTIRHRVKQLIRMQWAEYQRKTRRVRWYALNETFTVPDDFLVGELGVDTVMQRLIPEDGSGIYLAAIAPIAIRSPSAHSSRPGSLKLELEKIQHSLTSEFTGMFKYCFHVTEIRNLDMIREGLRPGGRRGGRMQIFFNPWHLGTEGSNTCWDRS